MMKSVSARRYSPACNAVTVGQISARRIRHMRLGRWRTISGTAGASALRLVAVHDRIARAAAAYQVCRTCERLAEPRCAAACGDIEGDATRVRRRDVGAAHSRGALQQPLDAGVTEQRVDALDLYARGGVRVRERGCRLR